MPSLSAKDVLGLPPSLVRELSDSFEFFDRNGDGKISEAELAAVMRSLGQQVSNAEIAKLINDVDANGDGHIDLYEFIDLNTRPINKRNSSSTDSDSSDGEELSCEPADDFQEVLASAFAVFDADKNGLISADELHRVLVAFGDAEVSVDECRRMIQCVDKDGDEMVNFTEFESLMSGTLVY